MFGVPMEQQMDMVTVLSCPFCDKTFTRQSTMTRHIQSVHGPMINCVHPKCNYSAPQNKPQQLQQHMAKAHDVHFYKDGSLDSSTTTDMPDPRMIDDEKDQFCTILRDAVLNLCRENYNSAVEVDGLICISVLNSKDQQVVKIHDLLTEDGQIFTGAHTHSKNNSNHKRLVTESNSPSMDTQPHPMLFVRNTSTSVENSTKSQLANSIRKRGQTTSTSSKVTPENSARFPFLVQTLQETHKNLNNRASSASPTIQPVSSTVTDRNNLYEGMSSSPVLDNDRPASSLLKILSNQKQQTQPQIPKPIDTSFHINQNDFNVSIKQEPVEEENETSQHMGHNSQNLPEEKSDMTQVKNEPTWDESEYGGTLDTKEIGTNSTSCKKSDKHTEKAHDEGSKKSQNESRKSDKAGQNQRVSKSLLAKILDGREVAYTKIKKGLATNVSTGSLVADKPIEKSDEQDNSLLYRLPFVTFQDLFPGGPTVETPIPQENNAVDGKQQGKQGQSVNLDNIMRKLLEGKAEIQKRTPKKRQKLDYDEDFSSEVDYSEEDFDSPETPSDNEDDNYVPSEKDVKVEDDDDHEFTMSLRKKIAKKSTRKRSVAVKSTTKTLKHILPSKEVTKMEDNQNDQSDNRYACYHCRLRFKLRVQRDRHEEENCINDLILCHVCKGYFANTSSRNKHLFEVHSILADEQKDEIRENRPGALEDLRPIEEAKFEFETLKDCEQTDDGSNIPSMEQSQFDLESSSADTEYITTLVTKFIVPYSVQNSKNFIKCPLCICMFSDIQTKDEHLRKKHNIANQIDNGDGTVSLQMAERTQSNRPPVFVKFEENT